VTEFEIVPPSVIEQMRTAARTNPDVLIRCPWCERGVLGVNYEQHAKTHLAAQEDLQAETPSSWMAL